VGVQTWLTSGNEPARDDPILQECNAGLIPIRRTDQGLAFAAPPLVRSGPVEDELVDEIASAPQIERSAIVDAGRPDNVFNQSLPELQTNTIVLSTGPHRSLIP
jgi:predicted PhzF superfamily epimerase YddE/YHI9